MKINIKIIIIFSLISNCIPIKTMEKSSRKSVEVIIASDIDTASQELEKLFGTLPVELKAFLLEHIIAQELNRPWKKKKVKSKLNKFFLMYLPAQVEIKDEEGKVTGKTGYLLTQEQIKMYLRKLDNKVTGIIKKTWQMPTTFLVKLFYEGNDREEMFAIINNKGLSPQEKERLLTTKYKEQINNLRREVLSYRYYTIPYIIETIPDSGRSIRLNSRELASLVGLNKWPNPENILSIHLQDNNLTDIPANIFNTFTNLNSLDLGNNQLKNIDPQAFNGLVQLYILNIENNKFDDSLNVEAFRNLPSLAILNLKGNQFSDQKKQEIKEALPETTVNF